MININFDPRKPYKAVVYARMSDPRQNARSPDQQIAEINRRIEALGYPWTVVRIYRDDGVSGRLVQKRKAFRKMLGDLKTGAVEADLILVDTFQRFGRAKELAAIRDDLQDLHGVILLTANSNFADPNTPQGHRAGTRRQLRGVRRKPSQIAQYRAQKKGHSKSQAMARRISPLRFSAEYSI